MISADDWCEQSINNIKKTAKHNSLIDFKSCYDNLYKTIAIEQQT